MKLITKQLEERFAQVGSQREEKDPLVIAKFFDPTGSATWYATEYDPEHNHCYGYVTGLLEDEWGCVSIDELEAIERPFGLSIERDIFFIEQPISELVPAIKRRLELEKIREEKDRENEPEIER